MSRWLPWTGLPASAWAGAAWAESAVPRLGWESLLGTLGGLLLVLGMILGMAWLLRRLGQLPGSGKGPLRILGGISVGTRERVLLVEVDEVRLVLGVAPGRVQTLHVLPRSGFAETLERVGGPSP